MAPMPFRTSLRQTLRARSMRCALVAMLALSSAAATPEPAKAHPHFYIDVALELVITNGTVVGIRHLWTFDEIYSSSAVDGLDKNKDGIYTRDELAELAKTNIEGLKEFNYFTYPTLAGAELKVSDPKADEGVHEMKDGKLTLSFFVPLASPVLAEAKDFQFSVYDPTFFIAFEVRDNTRVSLSADAPKSCKLSIAEPKKSSDDASRLGESFFSVFGSGNAGFSFAKPVTLTCGKL